MQRMNRWGVLAATLGLALLGASAAQIARSPAVPIAARDEGYAGSEACRACHAENHASWHASYHRTMTQVGSLTAIRAPWKDFTPPLEGRAWKLTRDGADSFAEPFDSTGKSVGPRTRVALTTGSHHYQIYWLEEPGKTELDQLPLVWHLEEEAWIPRHSLFLTPSPKTVFSESGRWTRTCIQCHTTNGTPKHGPEERAQVADFGISCEACHGPGAAHVAEETQREKLDETAAAALPREANIENPAEMSHVRSSQVCGQCHGIHPLTKDTRPAWEKDGFAYRPGDDLAATRDLLRAPESKNTPAIQAFLGRTTGHLDEYFWRDGQVRVSGREYNGLVESPCFQRGEMSCLSCHDMHPATGDASTLRAWADDQLRPGMDGPRACLQCHAEYGDAEKLAQHTHHAAGSSGSDCLNCHMPYTTYGLVKAIRSHTITSPSAHETLATGRQNACNACHLDRALAWTAKELAQWYGHAIPEMDADRREVAESVLQALSGDAGQRALAAWSFGWDPARAVSGTTWMPYVFSTLLQDPYDAVRFVAMGSLRADPRWRIYTLDFTRPLEEQRLAVRASVLRDWQERGLSAAPGQRAAVLIGEDGKLDAQRFRALYGRVDGRAVRLSE